MSDPWVNVDPVTIIRAINSWREQTDRLSGAATAISSAPTAGFGEGVVGDVRAFVGAWEDIAETTRDSAQDLSDALEDSLDLLQGADNDALNAFPGSAETGS